VIRLRPAVGSATLVAALALALTGCTPPPAAPTAWQTTVETVASQASSGDYATALSTLDALAADVTARRDAGGVSSDEAERLLASIATVRADLTALAPTPTPTPTPTVEASPTPEPAPQQAPPADDKGGEKGGNGGGNGKGPGGPGKKDG